MKGLAICRPGHGLISGVRVEERVDIRGLSYHWLQFRRERDAPEDLDCDYEKLRAGYITLTPLRADRHAEGDWQAFAERYGDELALD